MHCKNLKHRIPETDQFIPMIGFSTASCSDKKDLQIAVDAAVASGYRLFDTSASFGHERDLGRILREMMSKYNLRREEIFVTSKLPQDDIGPNAEKAVNKSFRNLDINYIDLYLIEWPVPKLRDPISPENPVVRLECWKSLIKAQRKGWVKHLGVANFSVNHLTGLLNSCTATKPIVNQIEWHPFWHPKDIQSLCENEGILIQAYHVLGGRRQEELFQDKRIISIAEELEISVPRLLLKWSLQSGVGVIPSSKTPSHITENINLDFDIPPDILDIMNNFKQTVYGPNVYYMK